MTYFPELYYFSDQKDFPFEKAILVTAQKLSEWCGYYTAELLSPFDGITDTRREGELPATTPEKNKLMEEVIKWILSNYMTETLFDLRLYDQKNTTGDYKPATFEYADGTCCFSLRLTQEQFEELKDELKKNGLPEYLYYPEDKAIKIIKPRGLIGKFFTALGFTWENSRIYSPKQWEEKNKKHE